MLQRQKTNFKTPTIDFVSPQEWNKGVMRYDRDKIPLDGLAITENVMLTQTGGIKQRPGLKPYGVQPTGTVIGLPYEYVRIVSGVPETWRIWAENRSGTGTIITAKDTNSHVVVTGKTYDITSSPHFEQIAGKVLITTGKDTLSYMDVQTQTITAFSALTQPSVAPTATASAALIGTNLTLRYRYAAANQGETAASSAGTAAVTKLREQWNGTTESMTVVFNRISGAQRYNLYVGDQAGFEYFLDTVADPGSGTTVTYVDTGSIAETVTRTAPVGDSTAGPKTSRSTNIKGQPYMTGDADNPERIWFGGNGDSALDFSSYNGGGWVAPNKGGKDFPVRVFSFRDGKGTPMAACLSKGTNGAGKRYLLQPSTTTVGSTVISYMAVQEDNGQDGTDSPDGLVVVNDAAFYPSRSGFKSSTTKPQIQNLISTNGISPTLAEDVKNLSSIYMASCVGLEVDQIIYWALPFNSTTNNQIWLLDLRNGGAWVAPWYINCNAMLLYADNSDGKTKFLMLVDNRFMEVDSAITTNDDGTLFQTNIGSGLLKFNKDSTMWGSVIDVKFKFLKRQGDINVNVIVNTEDGPLPFADTVPGAGSTSPEAWSRFGWGTSGWGRLTPNKNTVSSVRTDKEWTLDIDEECNSLYFNVGTTTVGASFELAEVIVRYVPVGFKQTDNT